MGELFGFICKNCNYKVTTVAGKGVIMRGEYIPYVCKSCKDIEDVFFDMDFKFKMLTIKELKDPEYSDDPKCSKCKKTMSEEWDTVNKPCPKCNTGKLEFDPEVEHLMID